MPTVQISIRTRLFVGGGFTAQNLAELQKLKKRCKQVFAVLVCCTDGMVCLPYDELSQIIDTRGCEQAWVRAERMKRQWYCVSGAAGELVNKKPRGLEPILSALGG